jgi:hypothetical protein
MRDTRMATAEFRTAIGAVILTLALASGCSHELPPIRQQGAWIVVENQTKQSWSNVTVTINSYYRGGASQLAAGGRLEAPLSSFETGLGQRFNTAREHVAHVEVRATDASGKPVALDWNEKTDAPIVPAGKQ